MISNLLSCRTPLLNCLADYLQTMNSNNTYWFLQCINPNNLPPVPFAIVLSLMRVTSMAYLWNILPVIHDSVAHFSLHFIHSIEPNPWWNPKQNFHLIKNPTMTPHLTFNSKVLTSNGTLMLPDIKIKKANNHEIQRCYCIICYCIQRCYCIVFNVGRRNVLASISPLYYLTNSSHNISQTAFSPTFNLFCVRDWLPSPDSGLFVPSNSAAWSLDQDGLCLYLPCWGFSR